MRAVMTMAALGALCGSAAAQSTRYPPVPVDKDAELAQTSALWNAAITPTRNPYQNLVRIAVETLNRRTSDAAVEAIAKLDEAIKLMPEEPDAYRVRGDAYVRVNHWAQCAADLAAAERYDEPGTTAVDTHRKLGLCQARSGRLAEAEQTFTECLATPSGEVWMRLGEVRVAMGKLDEGIAALRAALDSGDGTIVVMAHFALAGAYDRARRPADALAEAAEGVKLDRQLVALQNPPMPLIGPYESDYLLGVAYLAEPAPRPELALVSFRRYAAGAQATPWLRRAEEHVRELRARPYPEVVTRAGNASLDTDAARVALRRVMPQLRACLAKTPSAAVEVEILRAGPHTPSTALDRPRFFSPPDGVAVHRAAGALSDSELNAIDACVQPIASRVVLPTVKDNDTYYKATFYVVAP